MAGGKETPRQKMIGMMYLVLTALLALNVSAQILEKFEFLDESLGHAVEQTSLQNEGTLADIKKRVNERGKKPNELKLVKEAEKVVAETDKIFKEIDDLRKLLIDKTGGESDGGGHSKYKSPDQITLVEETAIGQNKKGAGYDLKTDLDKFHKFLLTNITNKTLKKELENEPLTPNGEQLYGKEAKADIKNQDWVELSFTGTPMVAALAVLNNKKAEIAKIESQVLGDIAAQVGASDFKFDEVSLTAMPESRIVAAGTEYKAQLFISATSSSLTPKMNWKHTGSKEEATELPEDKIVNGRGEVAFRASGGAYDKKTNTAKKSWIGSITFKGPTGPVTLTDTFKYEVAKPVMQIQSASVSALYYKCGNMLQVNVPALGEQYNPSFKVSGGYTIRGKNKGEVTIVPTGKKVVLSVSSNGMFIDKQDFNVRPIPNPTISIYGNRREIDFKKGFPAPGPRELGIKIIPDEGFASFLPKDARYYPARWKATLVRGKRPVGGSITGSGPTGNLSRFASQAKDGDRILVEIESLVRKNFQGKTESVNMPLALRIFNIPLHD